VVARMPPASVLAYQRVSVSAPWSPGLAGPGTCRNFAQQKLQQALSSGVFRVPLLTTSLRVPELTDPRTGRNDPVRVRGRSGSARQAACRPQQAQARD